MESISELTLKEIAVSHSDSIGTLDKYGLDYCCHGQKTLKASCAELNLDVRQVENDIIQSPKQSGETPSDFSTFPLDKMVSYILNTHHAYLRKQIPVITEHLTKVVTRHGDHHGEIKETAYCFNKLRSEIEMHMRKEEEILFPYICTLAEQKANGKNLPSSPFRTICNPIRMMEMEHDVAGEILREIRKWSGNFKLPADACTTFQLTFKELEDLEKDLHHHIHLENNILFPAAEELEKELLSA